MRTTYMPFVDHLLSENLTPRRRVNLTLDCPTVRLVRWSASAAKWKAKWEMANIAKRPNTHNDTIQEINPAL